MIGYYIHHQGRGHVHRAQALAAALDETVTGLSSLPRPDAWTGPWCDLPRDDDGAVDTDVTAGDQLHWAPLGHVGLCSRSAALSAWIEHSRPRVLVVDVSVEVTLLARLHGVPVVSVVVPGRRTDSAHLLGFRASSALVALWPAGLPGMTPGLPEDVQQRIEAVGGLSRFAPVGSTPHRSDRYTRQAVVLQGRGGDALTDRSARELEASTPGWQWTVLGGASEWVEDPRDVLATADVVVTHAGQGALADVAALRRPAVVVPSARPHHEQVTTGGVLATGNWPVRVLSSFPDSGWASLLDDVARLDGGAWERWCDGHAARRFAGVVARQLGHPSDRPA